MARTKQTKIVKPFGSPRRKFPIKPNPKPNIIVKAKQRKQEKKKARRMASNHLNQRIGLFKAEDMEAAIQVYRESSLPGYAGKPLSIRDVAERFKERNITFGSLWKRLSGEMTSVGPSSWGKGHPRVLPRDVEGKLNWIKVS